MLWIFYLQDIIYSFQYAKETPMLFSVILTIFLLRNRRKWIMFIIPVIILGFVSFGGVISANHQMSKGFMGNFWQLWEPAFNISVAFGNIFVYLQFLPYIIFMFYFIKNVKILSVEFGIFVMLSLLYSVIYSEPRYREPFMPLLFLFAAEPIYLKCMNIYYEIKRKAQIISLKENNLIYILEAKITKRFANIGKLIPKTLM